MAEVKITHHRDGDVTMHMDRWTYNKLMHYVDLFGASQIGFAAPRFRQNGEPDLADFCDREGNRIAEDMTRLRSAADGTYIRPASAKGTAADCRYYRNSHEPFLPRRGTTVTVRFKAHEV